MKVTSIMLCLCITFAQAASAAVTETLTFDDLPNPPDGGGLVPDGYGGLHWFTCGYSDGTRLVPSGYYNGIVSGSNVAFNSGGGPAYLYQGDDYYHRNRFDVRSAYFTGAWNDGLQIEAQGFYNGALIYHHFYTVDSTDPTFVNLAMLGVDYVVFSSSGGISHRYGIGAGDQFVMDNLTVTIVPEPSGPAIMTTGWALLWGLHWSRHRRTPSSAATAS